MVRALDLLQLMAMSSNPCNMAIFQFFSMAAAVILDFRNFIIIFNGGDGEEGRTTSPRHHAAEICRPKFQYYASLA